MALFGGKGVPTAVLVVLGAYWIWEVTTMHAAQIAKAYEGKTYYVAHGVELERNNPRWWITAHAACAAPVFIMWLLQASQEVRQWSYTFHRWNGRLSLLLFLPTAIFIPYRAFAMSQIEKQMELITQMIISLFGVFVLLWLVIGWLAIAKWKNVGLHRQCMLRALITSTFLTVIARFVTPIYKNYIRSTPYWLDELFWIMFFAAGAALEGVSYAMEVSFEKPWEFRALGFFRVWDAPAEQDTFSEAGQRALRIAQTSA